MRFTSVTLTISYRLTFVNPIFIKNAAFFCEEKSCTAPRLRLEAERGAKRRGAECKGEAPANPF